MRSASCHFIRAAASSGGSSGGSFWLRFLSFLLLALQRSLRLYQLELRLLSTFAGSGYPLFPAVHLVPHHQRRIEGLQFFLAPLVAQVSQVPGEVGFQPSQFALSFRQVADRVIEAAPGAADRFDADCVVQQVLAGDVRSCGFLGPT